METPDTTVRIFQDEVNLDTVAELDWKDITSSVRKSLAKSGMMHGLVNLFVPGSTGSIVLIESESGLISDLLRLASELIQRDREYEHEKRWQDGNAHSHLRATLFGSSLSVPFSDGQLQLGAWQQIIFIEFDTRPRKRKIFVFCIGV
jgi:secondary thiamine-phosphate synthase enzyme